MISQELLKILACPACKAALKEESETLVCAQPKCGLIFPVRQGIPVLLIEEALSPQRKPAA